jgi:hypothetical protein
MASEERDWIDRVIARQGWDPPSGFTHRVVVRAMTALPPHHPTPASSFGRRETLRAILTGFCHSMQARLEGAAWVAMQYRQLLVR